MKIEYLVVDVTGLGSLDRANHAISRVIVAGRVFDQPGPFVVGEPFYGVGTPS